MSDRKRYPAHGIQYNMTADQSKVELERRLLGEGLALDHLSTSQAVDAMLNFYRDWRADDCSIETDGDMLLYQWGPLEEDGREWFDLTLTRQFVIASGTNDEDIWQLSLAMGFCSTDELNGIASDNKWCSVPKSQAIDYFRGFIQKSLAYQAVVDTKPSTTELIYFNAG